MIVVRVASIRMSHYKADTLLTELLIAQLAELSQGTSVRSHSLLLTGR